MVLIEILIDTSNEVVLPCQSELVVSPIYLFETFRLEYISV